MAKTMTVDFDDFGANHIISDMCQSHDCRDKLVELKNLTPKFKVTLFTIPCEVTPELGAWCFENRDWVEIAYHGFFHTSNYECEKTSYEEFGSQMGAMIEHFGDLFVNGFKAPGWQISDDVLKWLADHEFWVADQSYNDERRPEQLPAYINNNGKFLAYLPRSAPEQVAPVKTVEAWHGHTWDCVGNGIYETFDQLRQATEKVDEFKFISEVLA
jgi:hypothetical protein